MATYFPNSSNQRDVAPTLYLRDPAASYPDVPGNMMMYMNYSSSSGSYSDTLHGSSQAHQNCVELPSVGESELNRSQQEMSSNFVGSHTQDPTYNVWRDGRNTMLLMQPTGAPTAIPSFGGTDNLAQGSVTEDSEMSLRTQLGIIGSGYNMQGQGLSLSLSTQTVPGSSFQFHHPNLGLSSFLGSHPTISGGGGSGSGSCRDDEGSQNKQSRNEEYFQPGFTITNHDAVKRETLNNLHCSLEPKQMHSNSYGLPGFSSTIPNSKYLKATQQLLDEVVNVRKALKQHESNKLQGAGSKSFKDTDGGSKDGAVPGMPSDNQETTTNAAGELSPAERQDLQNKLTKLLSMLDEVDRRYRQYYHQMQIVVSSFDVVAGGGAAKPYTALALEAISRHFRCLRDAISGQIKATHKSLGEPGTPGTSKVGGISRLRYVDQHLRQQKAFQQLGIMQQHAWRPQRGLPESSVSVLRAWLFEHFLHPYPKDSDKIMLARQTGLTRSQVSNWFINARVRLWKPMVEDMYKEEFGDNDMDSISSSENTNGALKEHNNNKDNKKHSDDRREELQRNMSPSTAERFHLSQLHESKCNPISDVEMSGSMAGTSYLNGPHGNDDMDYTAMKLRGDHRPNEDDSSLLQDDGRFISPDAPYQMAELGRFASSDGVSLTLGLQHCDGGGIPMSGGTHNNFITMRGDELYNAATSLGGDTADYECIDPGNRFNSSHMLHDFVA